MSTGVSIDAQADAEFSLTGAIPLAGRRARVADTERTDFDAFFTAEYPGLVTLLTAMTGDRATAEELAQEAMIRAHQRWGRVSGCDLPGAWVRRVAINLASNQRAKRSTEQRTILRLARQRRTPEAVSKLDEDFWAVGRRLPRRQAAAVALHYLEDRPVTEVASILGCAEGTAKAHLHKRRANLARLLENPETPHGS